MNDLSHREHPVICKKAKQMMPFLQQQGGF